MFKLTALLCAAMFCVLLIAGEDRGQLRPGLANAPVAVAQPTPTEPAPQVVLAAAAVAPADASPADVASVSAPVSVTPAPEDTAQEATFSLATYSDAPAVSAATSVAAPAQTAGSVAYVDARSVNVREGPGTDNPVLTRLTRGEAVTIVATDDTGWARIRLEGDGLEGFMSTEYLSATAP
ncbi:MAG: hypothetical protein RLZZ437_1708 [Pseudomonadota bacterium]|jgi:Bacterial SH3 domain